MTTAPHDESPPRHALTVLGAGVMGVGITVLALGHGLPVHLVDVDRELLDRAGDRIDGELRLAELMGALPPGISPGELVTGTSLKAAAGATAVIEAVTENAATKAAVLSEVSALVRPGTPLITNTSSIPVDELAGALERPEELVGTHFMNPPYLIGTAEVVRGPRTGEPAMAAVTSLLAALRRRAVVVRDAPGFVTSRILHPMINDAARVVEEGTATAEAVDALMQGCLGHPTGPLRTADLIGIDNLVDSLRVLHERTGDDGCRPSELLVRLVREGRLGRKSGRGFYDYT
ncbi:3-hydroxyacyl-CoA dehydrogenase family protein [Streptomyces uncialis]|uniref:3-hydroxyacyl-CoA dehydrogenase n=1 Tax=Streptomyces uncialis TaxID=1048205 RepID=A0A1Q4V955_9ACTN|nr:3-hydroxyacyl-CoA dehydrogenase family protein [Streptomyces uncialis]MCX4657986.1 3-hydroxyacyl-CoA dehydrogenase family protein [Streptomyces uncialis]OKH94373.1 3-hydroxyacyl-CoA dehydrogenase [Streptomyces uncialis]WTE15080.1 3-hydroxyacyl-CoA dehydrogenase family protein [Streptomyces uncialis]